MVPDKILNGTRQDTKCTRQDTKNIRNLIAHYWLSLDSIHWMVFFCFARSSSLERTKLTPVLSHEDGTKTSIMKLKKFGV